jgi:carbohydrate-binding DOMON domain-containing protein
MGGFFALAMLASWMNNQRLIRNVGDHLALYHQLRVSLLPRNCVRSSACGPMAHCWTTGNVAGSHCVIAWVCIRAAPGSAVEAAQ